MSLTREWLFHNSRDAEFRSPFGAVACRTEIALTLAVGRDRPADGVYLRLWREDRGEEIITMAQDGQDDNYLFYRAKFSGERIPGIIWYYFVVRQGGEIYYYGNNPGQKGGVGAIYDAPPPSYQISVYLTGAATPNWYKNTVVYQIFVDRFYNGNQGGKITGAKKGSLIHANWENDPVYIREMETGRILAYDFFGGNLAGVMAKLPYLKELGIGAIYLNPVFDSISNHKYDTADYKNIDPMFGDNAIFQKLCAEAAKLGMAIILDGVFSHTGSDSIYFNKEGNYPSTGAYQSTASPYFAWYRFSDYPDSYDSWWGVDALPNVNEMEPSYRNFIIHDADSVIRHWLRLGAKGWRLDVVDELPDQFIRELRQVMKETDADSVLIGEVWEDASNKVSYSQLRHYLDGDELDSPTNYPFREIVLGFFLGQRDAGSVAEHLMSLYENYPRHNFYAALNLVGSHDVPRILTLLGGHEAPALPYGQQMRRRLAPGERQLALARLKAVSIWQMTFPGVPHIYYGDEAGLEGYTDPLNRRTFPWDCQEEDLTTWYKKIIALRNAHPVLRTGHWLPLECHPEVFGFIRYFDQGKDVFGQAQEDNLAVVFISRSDKPVQFAVDISRWRRGMLFDALAGETDVPVGDGRFTVKLAPLEGKVLLAGLNSGRKKAGILLHPTSLPSGHGIGGLGAEARSFIDFLAAAQQSYWQILPLNPVGYGYSPYQSVSAFACEAALIDIDALVAEGRLTADEVAAAQKAHGIAALPADKVDYLTAINYKNELFRLAYERFRDDIKEPGYEKFMQANQYWLMDYALYLALTDHFGSDAWEMWPEDIAGRREAALDHYNGLLAAEVNYQCFLQYIFDKQWTAVKQYANQRGVAIIGDMPIFVAHHSADVWAHRRHFKLDAANKPAVVAGVPPDYFSETGQLWGNPVYRWRDMAGDDYRWWRERLARLLTLADIVRIDHFRGFEACWEVPAGEKTAENGKWVKGAGKRLFSVLEKYFPSLPVIAEDLGVITPAVTAIRKKFGYPGMKVLHFAFPSDGEAGLLECESDCVVYTGTHDNDTTLGWYRQRRAAGDAAAIEKYIGAGVADDAAEAVWRLIELAYQCKAATAVIPLQDVLQLDSAARMNMPGTVGDNWQWRCKYGSLTPALSDKLAALAVKYGRGWEG